MKWKYIHFLQRLQCPKIQFNLKPVYMTKHILIIAPMFAVTVWGKNQSWKHTVVLVCCVAVSLHWNSVFIIVPLGTKHEVHYNMLWDVDCTQCLLSQPQCSTTLMQLSLNEHKIYYKVLAVRTSKGGTNSVFEALGFAMGFPVVRCPHTHRRIASTVCTSMG